MANITSVLEKLWKKIYQVAMILSKKENFPYMMTKGYYKIYSTLDKFKLEAQKTVEIIRKNLLRSRPTSSNRQQLEDYMKRIEFANEVILSLDAMVTKTFDTYIEFINIFWEVNENFETSEQQKILSEKYDMSLTEWQGISSKIERLMNC